MRILVIGGTGFLGGPLVRRLRGDGHEVGVLHRGARCTAGEGHFHGKRQDVEAFAPALARFDPQVVIDLIAGCGAAAERTIAAVAGHKRRLVLVSSMDVYRAWGVFQGTESGDPEPGLLDESAALRDGPPSLPEAVLTWLREVYPWTAEGYDKLGMERAAAACGEGRERITVLRLPPLYGPGDRQRRLYPLWRRMRDGRPAVLLQQGLAEWRSARGYVENMAAGIALVACDECASGKTYNLADADNFSEAEWARKVAEAAGWQGRIVVLPKALMPPHLRVDANPAQTCGADTSAIRRELGFAEPVPADEAIRATLAWEREHPAEPAMQAAYEAEDAALRAWDEAAGTTAGQG